MTIPTGGGSDNPPDDTTIAEIEDAGIAPLREAADETESLVQLLEAYQQAPGETPEDIIDRMPEPERSQATELLARVTPALSDARVTPARRLCTPCMTVGSDEVSI